jgi:hypothetical protein
VLGALLPDNVPVPPEYVRGWPSDNPPEDIEETFKSEDAIVPVKVAPGAFATRFC